MKRPLATLLAVICGSMVASAACAQNLVITNARILDGAGGEIANGTIVVEGGVIQKSYKHLKDAVGSYEERKGVRLAAESADTADISAAPNEEPSPSHD